MRSIVRKIKELKMLPGVDSTGSQVDKNMRIVF